jgi:DNA-binding NarL/FixJ family response regulator
MEVGMKAKSAKASVPPKKTTATTTRTRRATPPKPVEPKIRVMIVDDHPLFRAGLRRVLELEDDLDVVGEAADGQVALEQAQEIQPQVILMDINLPSMNGLQVTRELTAAHLDTAVIVLTAYHDDEQMLHALRAGASAYFPKDVDPQELIRAIHEAAKSNYVVNDAVLAKPQVATWLLSQFEQMAVTGDESPEYTFQPLSQREMEILKCITRGQSNKEIAKLLGISRQTVKNHMTSILRKLAVNDRTQAAVYALRRGWIRLQDAR